MDQLGNVTKYYYTCIRSCKMNFLIYKYLSENLGNVTKDNSTSVNFF